MGRSKRIADVGQMPRLRQGWTAVLAAGAFLFGGVVPADGQPGDEEVDFHRAPEAWAMKYFASALLFTGYGAPRAMEPWETNLALEVVHIPSLDEDERRVGFGGSKPEDLNKAPAVIRPRLTLGLPADFSLTLSFAPPVEVFDDVRAALYAASLNRPLWETDAFRVGARVFGQYSRIRGSFTCPADHWDEPEYAPFCSGRSNDTMRAIVSGAELSASYRLDGIPGIRTDLIVFTGISGQYMDLDFEVDAPRADGRRDNRHLYTDGYTWAATAGLSYPITDRVELSGKLFYTPLSVQRPPGERDPETLLNSRVQVTYRF